MRILWGVFSVFCFLAVFAQAEEYEWRKAKGKDRFSCALVDGGTFLKWVGAIYCRELLGEYYMLRWDLDSEGSGELRCAEVTPLNRTSSTATTEEGEFIRWVAPEFCGKDLWPSRYRN